MSNLEQRCIRPGLWLIEGYSVQRSRKVWLVWSGPEGERPPTERPLHAAVTLSECREWIFLKVTPDTWPS